MIFNVTRAGGRRHCHGCNRIIAKNTKFLLYDMKDSMWKKYENYCPKCAIKKLNSWVKVFQGMNKELTKYLNWDQ